MVNKEKINPFEEWTEVIRPKSSFIHLGLYDLWRYRDLISLFVRRDFLSVYKQTILGPLWHIIQPLLTTLIFTFLFGHIANLSTDGAPHFLFYMAGVTMWNYCSHTLSSTANTFVNNAHIFGKVYFPRLTVPVSVSISAFISLGIQLSLFAGFYLLFILKGSEIRPTVGLLAMPWFLVIMVLWSIGLGIIISSITTKYQDLRHLITFGVQLYMYLSPVAYPISSLGQNLRFWAMLNPMAPVIEGFRYTVLGTGQFPLEYLILATISAILVFTTGVMIFNKVERTFMDTV